MRRGGRFETIGINLRIEFIKKGYGCGTTLAVPAIIIAETSLSFLGVGMRQPAISWGVLLSESQHLRTVAIAPWLLIPGTFVIIAVLSFNFLGDGLRDAADPYSVQH